MLFRYHPNVFMGGWLFSAVPRAHTHGNYCEARIVLAIRNNISPSHGGQIRQSYAKKAHVIIPPLWTFWRSTPVLIQSLIARAAAVQFLVCFLVSDKTECKDATLKNGHQTFSQYTDQKRLFQRLYIRSVVMIRGVIVSNNSRRSLHLTAIFAVLHTGLVIWVFDIT